MIQPWLSPDIAESIRTGSPKSWLAPDIATSIRRGQALSTLAPDIATAITITRGGGDGGGATTPTAKSVIDFVTGSYVAGGAVQDIGDILVSDPDETGGTFDAADVIPGSGLRGLANGGTTTPVFAGALLADMLSDSGGVTILFELTAPETPSGDALVGFDFFNSPTWDEDMTLAVGVDSGNFVFAVTMSSGLVGGTIPADQDDVGVYAAGLCRVAITGTPTSVAISVNGGDAARFDLSPAYPWADMTKGYFGNTFDADYLRSIKVYSPQNDATMKALSALA